MKVVYLKSVDRYFNTFTRELTNPETTEVTTLDEMSNKWMATLSEDDLAITLN